MPRIQLELLEYNFKEDWDAIHAYMHAKHAC